MRSAISFTLVLTLSAFLAIAACAHAVPVTGGTGPGGVETTDGTSGLNLWLRADANVEKDDGGGGFVAAGNAESASRWLDQSGYGNHATQTTASRQPTYETGVATLNNLPTISFSTGGGTQNFDLPDFMDFSDPTVFVVGKKDAGTNAVMMFGAGAHSTDTTLQFRWHGNVGAPNGGYWIGITDGSSNLIQTLPASGSSPGIFDYHLSYMELDGQTATVRYNGTSIGSGTNGSYVSTNFDTAAGANNSPNIGVDANGSTYALNGDIAEVVVFDAPLGSVERVLVENHLASKYNLGPIANDHYSGDMGGQGDYDFGVFGIGDDGTTSVTSSGSEGFGIEATSTLGTNEWILAGHKVATNGLTTADVPLGEQRWTRVWYVDNSSSVDATLSFGWSDSGLVGPLNSNFDTLYYSPTNAFSFTAIAEADGTLGDLVFFNLTADQLQNGYYTLGTSPPIPEPSSFLLLGLGFVGLAARRRRSRPSTVARHADQSEVRTELGTNGPATTRKTRHAGLNSATTDGRLQGVLRMAAIGILCLNFAASARAGMVAYWPWDNSVVDATGQVSPNGVLEPAATPAGFSTTVPTVGGTHSLDLSPANSRFRVPFQSAVQIGDGNDFTLSMWINPSASGTNGAARIFDTRGTGNGGTAAGLQIKINETNGTGWAFSNVFLDNGSNGTELISTGTGYTDAWHHIAVAYNATTEQIRFFVDGSPETGLLNTAAVGNFDGGKDLSLGSEIYATNVLIPEPNARTQKYTGLMDELAIFDELLTDAQIAQLAAGTLLPSSFLPPPIPEPSSFLLLGLGVFGLMRHTRRRRRRA